MVAVQEVTLYSNTSKQPLKKRFKN